MLVSAMLSVLWRGLFGLCATSLRLPRLKIGYLPLLVLAILVQGTVALSCEFPCNPSSCARINPSSCEHGIVKDVCECCDVCGKGIGEICSEFGKCGDGLVCVQGTEPGLTEEELRAYPSFCEPAPATPIPGTSATSTTAAPSVTSPGVLNASNCTNTSSTPDHGGDSSGVDMLVGCREPCSVEFCSDRARICSATNVGYKKVAKRSGCQHTSCNACFLLIRPDCDHRRCPEPPNKRCLRVFYECVRDHYYGNSEPVLLRLDDPRVSSVEGEILCHVPEVEESLMSAG